VEAPAALIPPSFHEAAEGPLKRSNSALYEGFRRCRTQLVVLVPRRPRTVGQRGAATDEISRNAQEAASGTQEVNDIISGVSEVATEAGQSAGKVLLAARNLSS